MSHDMVGKSDLVSRCPDQVSQDKIVRIVVREGGHAADFLQRVSPGCHDGTQCEAHAFHHVGDHYTRGHLYRHAERLQRGPPTRCWDTAIEAGYETDLQIEQRGYDIAHKIGCDLHITIGDDKIIVRRVGDHFLQREDLGVRPAGRPGKNGPAFHVRIAPANLFHHTEGGVVSRTRT